MYEEQIEIETKLYEIIDLLKILKDAVENNDDAYYLLNFVEIICSKTDDLSECFEEYDLSTNQCIIAM